MAKPRKTATIQEITNTVNQAIANCPTKAGREALGEFISKLLMDTNNYGGYTYIYWDEIGYEEWVEHGRPTFPEKEKYIYGIDVTDKSFVKYFVQVGPKKKWFEFTEKEVPLQELVMGRPGDK